MSCYLSLELGSLKVYERTHTREREWVYYLFSFVQSVSVFLSSSHLHFLSFYRSSVIWLKVMLLFMWRSRTHKLNEEKTQTISHRIASFGIARSQWVNIYYVKAFTDFCGEMVCHCAVSYYTLHSMLLLWLSATAVVISFLFMQCNVSTLILACVCLSWCCCCYYYFSCPLGCWMNKISRERVCVLSFALFLLHARSFSTFFQLKCA